MEKIQIKATKAQIEALKESLVWLDIVEELESWKTGFLMELQSIVDEAASENPSTASVLLHMGDLNGRMKAVDYFVSILDIFLQTIEDKKDGDSTD